MWTSILENPLGPRALGRNLSRGEEFLGRANRRRRLCRLFQRVARFGSGHLIDGIFTEPTLEPGYNLVAVVPRGALALNVTELRHTQNYLGKKRKIFFFVFLAALSID